jgi:hypothetical protein
VGEDADNGTCTSALAYHYDKGTIDDIDVSGLTVALCCFIPGNILKGNWKVAMYIDEQATEAQTQALLSVYKGERGGPIADMGKLIGEVVSVKRVPIRFDVKEGKGTLEIGDTMMAELEPYRGPTGEPTRLVESIFSTIPGSPAFVGKASTYRMKDPGIKADVELSGRNAIQGYFSLQH